MTRYWPNATISPSVLGNLALLQFISKTVPIYRDSFFPAGLRGTCLVIVLGLFLRHYIAVFSYFSIDTSTAECSGSAARLVRVRCMRLLDAVFFPCLSPKPKKSVLRDLRFDLFDNLSEFHLRLCLDPQTNGNPLGIRAEA